MRKLIFLLLLLARGLWGQPANPQYLIVTSVPTSCTSFSPGVQLAPPGTPAGSIWTPVVSGGVCSYVQQSGGSGGLYVLLAGGTLSGNLNLFSSNNAVYYADQYSGSTADVKINACITAAIAGGKGAVCDARGLGGAQTIAATVNVGDHAQDAVTLLLPKQGKWNITINDGASCAIKQFSNSNIIGLDTGEPNGVASSNQFSFATSSAVSLGAFYCTETAAVATGGGSYLLASGFQFTNAGAATTSLGAAMVLNGLYDNSTFSNILIFDGKNASMSWTGLCCGVTFNNLTLDGLQTATAATLKIVNTSTQYNEGVICNSCSVGHPAATYNNIAFTNSGTFTGWDEVQFNGLYTEGNSTDTTTPLISADSVASLSIFGWKALRVAGSSTAYALQLSHTGANYVQTDAEIHDFAWAPGSGTNTNCIYDTVNNLAISCYNLGIGSGAGGLPFYSTNTSYINGVNVLSALGFVDQGNGYAVDAALSLAANGVVAVGTGAKGNRAATIESANTQYLASDTSGITTTSPGVTEWSWTKLAPSDHYSFHCSILFSQATGAGGVGLSVQSATTAATRLDAWAKLYTTNPASTTVTATLGSALNITSTTATSVASATPGATGTVYQGELDGTIQTGSTAGTLNVLVYSGNSSDAVTVKAGSYCSVLP